MDTVMIRNEQGYGQGYGQAQGQGFDRIGEMISRVQGSGLRASGLRASGLRLAARSRSLVRVWGS